MISEQGRVPLRHVRERIREHGSQLTLALLGTLDHRADVQHPLVRLRLGLEVRRDLGRVDQERLRFTCTGQGERSAIVTEERDVMRFDEFDDHVQVLFSSRFDRIIIPRLLGSW